MRAKIGFVLVVLCSVLVAPLSGREMTDGSREEGAPVPRIACSGVYLYPDRTGGTYADGEPCSLEEIARYDLIIGIYGPWQEAATWPVLRKKLAARLGGGSPSVRGRGIDAFRSLPAQNACRAGSRSDAEPVTMAIQLSGSSRKSIHASDSC